MKRHYDVIIIGGGQAGLSTSYFLTQNGIDHLILDRGRVGDTWKNKRWDSFCLVTKNWQCNLPGFKYDGNDPEGFMSRDEIVQYIKNYAESFQAPFKSCVNVNKLSKLGSTFILETSEGKYYCDQVVIATGTYQKNNIPEFAKKLSDNITQLHSSEYKNPDQSDEGSVLIVGSGQSGCQIAEDLFLAGKKVYLSVSKAPRVSRRYRGKDILEWANIIGLYDITIDNHPEGEAIRFKAHPHVSGRDGGKTINLKEFGQKGITLLGRLNSIENDLLYFADDLVENLNSADAFDLKMKRTIDEYIFKNNLKVESDVQNTINWSPELVYEKIKPEEENINTVIWSTGYKYDYSWVDLPVFDKRGYPIYERGVTGIQGLYFVGLHWLHTWGSALFYGVGKDAEYIVNHIMGQQKLRKVV